MQPSVTEKIVNLSYLQMKILAIKIQKLRRFEPGDFLFEIYLFA